ncbi:MAG TPA: TetR family transcriptional regulator [Pseudonocardiaceae bacterium]|nr:TetR family transcriptional regulator [Pseudonocardiaceae bacterium]
MPASDSAARPMRADARRNCDLLIATAREVFSEKGAEAPLDEIAKRAGVGAGTLYRHFPNREALVEAVYRGEVDALANRATELLADLPPAEALAQWMREQVMFVNHRRGLAVNLKSALKRDSETMAWCRTRMIDAGRELLTAAAGTGAVRPDIEPFDLLRLGHGLAVACEFGSDEDGERMLGVVLAGLRTP